MDINMPRGDMRPVEFHVRNLDGEKEEIHFDEIYFTVKRHYMDKNFLFQKRLSTGEIEMTEEGTFSFVIMPEDTDSLAINQNYDFDIELVIEGEMKQTFTGTLLLTKEVTHAANEV